MLAAMLLKVYPSPWISVEVLAILMVMLLASGATFWALVRRWESRRQWTALREWGSENGFRVLSIDPASLPVPLNAVKARNPLVRLCLAGDDRMLLQFQTEPIDQADSEPGVDASAKWHILIRNIEAPWHVTGLRPTNARSSLLDLFSLSSYPSLGAVERFMVYGVDSAAARALSDSMTRSLLPPDIGMLLHGNHLLLDFSQRPFDEVEFNRMLALAEQIVQKLPAPR
jgi:hypothetical protein